MMQDTKKSAFLDHVNIEELIQLYELIPGVLFWIKDIDGKIQYCNKYFVEHVGMTDMQSVVGLTDYDISPPHIANQFVVDDKKVIKGELVTERLELNVQKDGTMAWFTTSKRPLVGGDNTIIGTIGISHHLEHATSEPVGMGSLQLSVDYIRENYSERITVDLLAELNHLSVSALERRFKKYLSKTPLQFINEVRLEHARRLLVETNYPIGRVASDCGYSEHSYFTRQFNKFFKVMPSEFRNKYQKLATKH